MATQDLPLLAIALVVFAGLFGYLWMVDARTRRLERELRDEIAADEAGPDRLSR